MIFIDRMLNNIEPYYYIGCKSKCVYENGLIIGNRGEYWGSSKDKEYIELLEHSKPKIEIISWFDDYNEALLCEKEYHINHNVVKSSKYFNKSIATISTYHKPNFGTFKCVISGKIVRLNVNDPDVINGNFVGVTKGYIQTDECKNKKKRFGEDNHFFSKKHSVESINKMSKNATIRNLEPEFNKMLSENCSKRFKGVPKSEEHKKKIGRKGFMMIKNLNTGECLRILVNDRCDYDKKIWVTPFKYKSVHDGFDKIECKYCNKIFKKCSMFYRWHDTNCKEYKGVNNEN